MTIAQIEKSLKKLIASFDQESFIYDLLLAYGLPKASITRLKKGNLNLSKVDGELSWKKKVLFKEEFKEDLHISVSELVTQAKHNQRFVIVTDYKLLLAIDTKTDDKLDMDLKDLPKHYDFFLPWAGMEKSQHQNENPADVKAAEKMAKLFDEIKADNPDDSPEFVKGLNVFLSRLLFCFFAEDTGIFDDGQFINAISSHTQKDGSDLHSYLEKLFEVLDTSPDKRKGLPAYLEAFPYVNGKLFRDRHQIPEFTRRSRQAIIDSGTLDWSAINPDIFGSMIQAVVTPEHRGGLGMHYTSVPNIMKVIEPLFLNDVYDAFEKGKHSPKQMMKLLNRLSKIKVFDPACGSGNFLIIAYKELRKLEIRIIKRLLALKNVATGFEQPQLELIPKEAIPHSQLSLAASYEVEMFSRIDLVQFFGIELDDFAHEIAQLSLWLAEHQMNLQFQKEFGTANPTLPLKGPAIIVHGNACRIDWDSVCPKKGVDEIYLLGNPPYLGYSVQDLEQKKDMLLVLSGVAGYKSLDYIACWFYKASIFIENCNAAYAFVSTNSICQGEQVGILWPSILSLNLEIGFAHTSFKWSNNAKSKAQVICVIIGLRNIQTAPKYLISKNHSISCKNISPYLINSINVIVFKRNSPLSNLPAIGYGSSALDGGHLMLTRSEKDILIKDFPETAKFVKPVMGSQELIKGLERWCIWIEDEDEEDALEIPPIEARIKLVETFRKKSKRKPTIKAAQTSFKFGEPRFVSGSLIVLPKVSSERRVYLPIGYFHSDVVVMDKAFPLYNAEPFLFGLLSSRMHMEWVKTIGGRLKSDFSYSSSLCYNTFSFPKVSNQRKQEVTQCVFRILEEREKHPEKTLAQLYDPDKMPDGLREAHHQNDLAIERCYRSKPFESDEERLEYLFKLYEQMIEEEKQKGGLFEKPKKKRR